MPTGLGSRSSEGELVVVRLEGGQQGTEDPRRIDRRFGVKMGVMEGGLYPIIKKLQKKGLATASIQWSLCCFPWGPQWELGACYSAEAH